MSLVWPVLAGLAVALVLGGKLQRLAALRWHGLWLFYAALAIRIVAFPFYFLPWRTPETPAKVLYFVSYGLLVFAVALNARIPGVAVVATGMTLNLVAIAANSGHMPALPSALRAAGLHFRHSRNSEIAVHAHLPWLIDRWAAPDWIPRANVFSVGDVIVGIGSVVFALMATGALTRWTPKLRARRASEPVAPTA